MSQSFGIAGLRAVSKAQCVCVCVQSECEDREMSNATPLNGKKSAFGEISV